MFNQCYGEYACVGERASIKRVSDDDGISRSRDHVQTRGRGSFSNSFFSPSAILSSKRASSVVVDGLSETLKVHASG